MLCRYFGGGLALKVSYMYLFRCSFFHKFYNQLLTQLNDNIISNWRCVSNCRHIWTFEYASTGKTVKETTVLVFFILSSTMRHRFATSLRSWSRVLPSVHISQVYLRRILQAQLESCTSWIGSMQVVFRQWPLRQWFSHYQVGFIVKLSQCSDHLSSSCNTHYGWHILHSRQLCPHASLITTSWILDSNFGLIHQTAPVDCGPCRHQITQPKCINFIDVERVDINFHSAEIRGLSAFDLEQLWEALGCPCGCKMAAPRAFNIFVRARRNPRDSSNDGAACNCRCELLEQKSSEMRACTEVITNKYRRDFYEDMAYSLILREEGHLAGSSAGYERRKRTEAASPVWWSSRGSLRSVF